MAEKNAPVVLKKENKGVLIQFQERKRDKEGKMRTTKTKCLTVYNLMLDKAFKRVEQAFGNP